MALESRFFLFLIALLVVLTGIAIGLFFVIRYFVRYHAQLKKEKTQQQEEIEKMKLEDL